MSTGPGPKAEGGISTLGKKKKRRTSPFTHGREGISGSGEGRLDPVEGRGGGLGGRECVQDWGGDANFGQSARLPMHQAAQGSV